MAAERVRMLLPQRLHSDARCLDGALVVEAVADQDIVLVYGCGRAALQTLDGDVRADVVDVRLDFWQWAEGSKPPSLTE